MSNHRRVDVADSPGDSKVFKASVSRRTGSPSPPFCGGMFSGHPGYEVAELDARSKAGHIWKL